MGLKLGRATGSIVTGLIIDHNIAARFLDREGHCVPLPESCSKLDDAENKRNQDANDQCRFDGGRSLLFAEHFESPAHLHYPCYWVRTIVLAVSDAGQPRLAYAIIGVKLCVAVTDTYWPTR